MPVTPLHELAARMHERVAAVQQGIQVSQLPQVQRSPESPERDGPAVGTASSSQSQFVPQAASSARPYGHAGLPGGRHQFRQHAAAVPRVLYRSIRGLQHVGVSAAGRTCRTSGAGGFPRLTI